MISLESLRTKLTNINLYLMLGGEVLLFISAFFVAYSLRFEFNIPASFFEQMVALLPAAVCSKVAFFWLGGLYRGMWRYTGLSDLRKLGQAVLFAEIFLILYVVYAERFTGYPRSVFVLDALLAFVFACGARVFIRTMYEATLKPLDWKALLLPNLFNTTCPSRKVLVVGADDAGARIAKAVIESFAFEMTLVGFVDDDSARIGRKIHGIQVYGPLADLASLIRKTGAEEVLINAAKATSGNMRNIIDACDAAQIRVKKLPAFEDLVSGKVSVKSLRDVRYEEVLGREEVHLDVAGIEDYLRDKVVLVTGAGGSIGSELCRQILAFQPRLLVLYDAGEANLYGIEMELKHERGFERYVAVLGQVQDEALLAHTFEQFRPSVVFHAAAYKHVPMLEANPWQAVTNNILGSKCAMEMSVRYEVDRFVLVSTDKAVRPTNVMGASKRVTELLMRHYQGGTTKFMAVRFGNVLGSSGSVIPLFRKQIALGGPITVTHPDVTRYFMTIPEAAQLIVQAGALGLGGEIFILKMGQPIKIVDLARDLIILSGKTPDEIEIRFTGLRPGEKLYEELITAGEGIVETEHEKIMVLLSTIDSLEIDDELRLLFHAANNFDKDRVKSCFELLVSEYTILKYENG